MNDARSTIRSIGNEPPMLADGRRAPDRREISFRWLSGTFLTGITSSILMGVALFAALDGRQQLAIPAEASASIPTEDDSDTVQRGKRLLGGKIVAMPTDRKIMEVSTVVHEGNREVVRRRPFAHVKMNLAADHVAPDDYPDFDPLTIFSSSEAPPPPANRTGLIYGSNVESEVSLQTVSFPTGGSEYAYAAPMTAEEVEENVRSNGSVLSSGNAQLSALYYVDPQRFSTAEDVDLTAGITARIVEENMTVAAPEPFTSTTREYADDIIPVRRATTVTEALTSVGYPEGKAKEISGYLEARLGKADVVAGDVLRIGVIQEGQMALVVRASLYRRGEHRVTVGLDDRGRFIDGEEPPMLAAVTAAFSDQPPQIMTGRDLPRVYDGIYRAALSYGMNNDMTALLVKLLASNVDLQAQLRSTDRIEAFFSVADEEGKASKDSELLYVNARFGDNETRFYRFQNLEDENAVDYFDENGKSIRQFLLRNPVPNARMTSGFGMRAHPILGRSLMHTGTDWAAPRGTPIIAAGNGIVEKAGWDSGGYGNQTLIRHGNGYVSSYNHQSAIARGVREGAKVTQGQVIGYVGSTGQSTGAHLHYELIVNGTKVDPMKVRLPGGKSLEGPALARFEEERKRIDALLNTQPSDEVASR
jgi:murein DD-endopeptidase MepM/ murein hydrolase activator NlpD